MKDKFIINGCEFDSRLFHCFGTKTCRVESKQFAVDLIKRSGTNFLTLYTHGDFENFQTIDDFPIGYGGLTFADIKNEIAVEEYTILVNTNHALSVEEAVYKARKGAKLCGSKYIKLEILNAEGTLPVNEMVLKAAKILVDEGYIVLPIIDRFDIYTAKELENIGCAGVRILLSEICSGGGLKNPEFLKFACNQLSIPVIAEGGMKCPEDAYNAMALGADAVLVNAVMFLYENPLIFIDALKNSISAGRDTYLCNLQRK